MNDRICAGMGAMVAVLALLLWLATPALAQRSDRPGYLGVGLTSSAVDSDLDGNGFFVNDTNTIQVFPGKLDDGTGFHLMIGGRITDIIAIEGLLIVTGHDATHAAFPGETQEAAIATLLGNARFMLPLGDSFDLFARVGLGLTTLSYEDAVVLPPSTVRQEATMSGGTFAVGGGLTVHLDPIALELSMLNQSTDLDSLEAAGETGGINDVALDVNSVLLTLVVAFGNP